MNLSCDPDLEDSKQLVFHNTLWLKCCTTIPSLVTKCSAVQKTSGQTCTDLLNLRCCLDLEHSNITFPQDTPANNACTIKPSFGCKQTSGLEDIVETVIF